MTEREELEHIVDTVITNEQEVFGQLRQEPRMINYLIGKVMQKTRGSADPELTLEMIREKI